MTPEEIEVHLKELRERATADFLANGGSREELEAQLTLIKKATELAEDYPLQRVEEIHHTFGGFDNFVTATAVMGITDKHFQAMFNAVGDLPKEKIASWTAEGVAFGMLLNLALLLRDHNIDGAALVALASRAGLALDTYESDMQAARESKE